LAKSGWTLHISPKSAVASGSGHLIAQNMMYRHSITVYNRSYRLVKTISDRIDLQDPRCRQASSRRCG
jgi:hypothetical protein